MSLVSALFGIIAYAAMNVIMVHKLSNVSPIVIIPIYTLFVSVTTFGVWKVANMAGYAVSFSVGDKLPWLLLIGVLIIIADFAYLGAYGMKGASMATITTCAALLPVIAVIIEKLCIGGELPSLRTIGGFALAVFTVWVVAFDPSNLPIKQ